MKPSAMVTLIFLSLVAALHLFRLLYQVPITVDTVVVPVWASGAAFLAVGALAVWLWREQKA